MNVKAGRLPQSLARLIQYTPSYLNKCMFIQWQKNLVSFFFFTELQNLASELIHSVYQCTWSSTDKLHVGMFVILTNFYYVCPLTTIEFLPSLILL